MLVIVGLVLVLRLFAMTPMAHSIVINQIESTQTRGQSINVEGLRGDLLGRFSIDRLTVEDDTGVWLSIGDVDLAWAPMGLFSSELRFKTLNVNEIDVRRRPDLLPSTRETQSSFVDQYELGKIKIDRVILANGVAGPAQAYTLSGTLEATNAAGQVALNLQPIIAVGDTLDVDLRWGETVPLEGDLMLYGAPSGLFATLLDLPQGRPLTATLEAAGGLEDWDLVATAAVADVETLDLRVTRSGEAYRSSGTLLLSPFGRLAPVLNRIGPRISGSIERDTDGLLFANLQTDRGGIAGQGRLIDADDLTRVEDFVLAISSLDAASVVQLESLDVPSARATGVLEIEAQTVRFSGDLSVPNAAYGGFSVQDFVSRGEHSWSDGGLELDVALQSARPSGLPKAVTSRLADAFASDLRARFDLAARRLDIASVSLTSGTDTLQVSGTYDLGGAIDLAGQFNLQSVTPLDTLVSMWRVEGPSLSNLDVTVEGRASLASNAEALSQVIGEAVDLQVQLTREEDSVRLQAFQAQSEQIQAQASGQLLRDQLELFGDVGIPTLELSGVSARGLRLDWNLSGPFNAMRFESEFLADSLIFSGEQISQISVRAAGELTSARTFDVEAASIYRDAPLTAQASGSHQDDRLVVEALNLLWDELFADGFANIDLSDLQNSNLSLNTKGQAPLIREIDGQIQYADAALDADISLADAAFGGVDVRSANLQAMGTWPNFSGALTYAGDIPFWSGTEPVTGSHDWRLNPEARALSLGGSASLAGERFEITSPIQIRLDEMIKANGSLRALGGTVDVLFDNSGRSPTQLSLAGLSMQRLGSLIQRPGLRGRVSGAANLTIAETGLEGQGAFQIVDLARGDSARADVDLSASLSSDALAVVLRAEDAEDSLSLEAAGGTRLVHTGSIASVRTAPDAPFPIQIQGRGPIAPLWALAAPSDLRLDGIFDIDLSNGDGRAFRFAGSASIEDGVFEDGFTGLHLEEINAQADLTPDAISVREATARGGNSGTLQASGAYRFDGDSDVTLVLNRLSALNRSDVSAEISGQASLDRRQRRTHVEGDLRVDEARINLSKLPGAGYTTLDVVFADPGEPLDTLPPEREAISLNLNVSADRRVFVNGPGVESEWGIAARVTGSPGAPQVNGRATLVRGEADLLSRSFRLTEGTVRFAGDPQDSEVALRADRTSDGITTSINLAGTITDPEISLSSDPSLPDDEILARVLFGRSPSNLSPLQAAQLAAAAAQLAGGDAISLTGQLEEATGLDRLDFGFDEDGEATLSTGKYLADDLYLEVESGGSGAPGVALEWTPLANVELDAEIDPELGPKVAIQWKRDFDRLPGEAPAEPPARASSND